MSTQPPLSSVLPPLILGTATFNTQYHPDPTHMPYVDIVRRALLTHGITAFDTSPYYGPSEILLGDALQTVNNPRSSYLLITKAGRIAADTFDYSPAAIRSSVRRSLSRLHTPYLDLVYAHDVEFVTPEEVLAAVTELRRLRDEEGLLCYVGISGYPVKTLASLAEMIYRETGEALDAVLSYNHFCVQNTRLGDQDLLQRFHNAGVECLLNASMLGMGLLTTRGVDGGPMATWHPAPAKLRQTCNSLKDVAQAEGEHLEEVSIRWSLDNWARIGADFGTTAIPYKGHRGAAGPSRMGISVMGVSSVAELDETSDVWRSVVNEDSDELEVQRREKISRLVADKMWPVLGRWKDYYWSSGLSRRDDHNDFDDRREQQVDIGEGDDLEVRLSVKSKPVAHSSKI